MEEFVMQCAKHTSSESEREVYFQGLCQEFFVYVNDAGYAFGAPNVDGDLEFIPMSGWLNHFVNSRTNQIWQDILYRVLEKDHRALPLLRRVVSFF